MVYILMVFKLRPILVVLLLVVSGCGIYTFNPAGKTNIKAIAVERIENKTSQYDLTDRMTDLVIDAFLEDGTFKVVSSENADAVLAATFTSYVRIPYEYDENDVVTSYSVKMSFDVALKKPGEEADIWKETMVQEGIYNADSETEEDGQQRAVDRLIDAIIDRTTKSW